MVHSRSTSLPDARDLLGPAAQAVLDAGSLLRAEFHRPGGPRGEHGKAPVDTEIEQFLRSRLLDLHPCDWHGEEIPLRITGSADRWVVDPQDGTRAFLKGLRGSAISVALIRDGRPLLGVVYSPTAPDDAGDIFAWADGLPPTRNGEVLPALGLGGRHPYGPGTVLGLNEKAGDYAAFNHSKFSPAVLLAIPSIAYRLALAAAGEVDAAISLTSGLDPYDVAGGHALLNAVGGVFVQVDGTAITYGPHASYRGCIGGCPEVVSEVVRRRPGIGPRVARKPARPSQRVAAAEPLGRAHGTLLGQLAGDALGSLVEFMPAEATRREYPDGVVDLRAGGHWNTLSGQPTDDGEMALALARAIVAEGTCEVRAVAAAYVAWAESHPFDIGTTTAAGIQALRGRGRPVADSEGNGALMRVSPVGVFATGRPHLAAMLARADAALTHPNPVCLAASAAYAAAIAAGVGGADSRTMWSVGYANAGDDEGGDMVRKCLEESLDREPSEFQRNQGWVLIALQNAFYRLYSGQLLERAVIETVGRGGDTDTNAAICGALLGAAQGREAVPLRWRRFVCACRPVGTNGVRHPRPTTYWPDDALDLAEALLAAGR